MFRLGLGVMQSNDAAIEHYRVGASVGGKYCAIGMFSSYITKFNSAKPNSPAYQSAVKSTYAWAKVTQGLGVGSYIDTEGSAQNLSERIFKHRQWMVSLYGESFANDADDRASEICSTITDCIQ